MPGAQQTIYRSRTPAPALPQQSVWDYLFDGVAFDDARLVYAECQGAQRRISLGELKSAAQHLGASLLRSGLRPGDAVLLLLPNGIDFIITLFATQFAGLRASFINPAYTRLELRHIWRTLGAKRIFVTSRLLPNLTKAGLPWDKAVVLDVDAGNATTYVKRLLIPLEESRQVSAHQPASLDQTCYMPWSSGTTGLPKAVELSHRNVVAMLLALQAIPDLYDGPKRTLGCLPFFHAVGLIKLIHLPLAMRGTLYILTPFRPDTFCEVVRREKIQGAQAVPPIIVSLLGCAKGTREYLGSLEHIACGAAPLSEELQSRAEARFGVPILQSFGMSETTVSAVGMNHGMKPGGVGWLLPGVEARLVTDDGHDAAPGERGELLLRGPNMTKGYFRNEEATREAKTPDGWLHTGDVAVVDESGQFTIVDRKKELIKYKGFQVPPAELEGLLLQHPSVAVAAVVGIYDAAQATELPRAYVQLHAGVAAPPDLPQQLQAWVQRRTSPQKRLRGGVRVLQSVPISASGKVLRKEMRLLAKREQEEEAQRGASRAKL